MNYAHLYEPMQQEASRFTLSHQPVINPDFGGAMAAFKDAAGTELTINFIGPTLA